MALKSLFRAGPSGGSIHELLRRLGVSESVAHTIQVESVGPLRILTVLLVAFIITRLVPRVTKRLVNALQLKTPLRRQSERADNRALTLAAVLTSVFKLVVWVVAVLTILGVLGINLAPFVATATVIGAAVGFGAQSLVKDFLSGMLIIVEDQYGVGDSIVVGDTTGTVEGLNLRTTSVRGLDGVVWYIPNGEIRKVGNSSDAYSQALVDILVPPGTDLTRAGELMNEEARAMAHEPAWQDVIVELPSLWGVQAIAADSVTLRLVARTTPGDHFRVARALRTRCLERLRVEEVAWTHVTWGPTGSTGAAGSA